MPGHAPISKSFGRVIGGGPAWGIAAGILFAAGDVSTKMAVTGGRENIAFLLCLIVFYLAGTAVLQAGFQRGTALTAAGLEVHETDEDVMRVFVPGEGAVTGGDQRRICEIALGAGVQVRHLRASVPSLEDVFARAIGET